jgi:hypothetical protein
MKTKLILFVTILFAQSVLGYDHFFNLREGKSRLIGEPEKTRLKAMYKKYGKNKLDDHFTDMFQTKEIATCASVVVKKLTLLETQVEARESLAYTIRDLNIIDDIALEIILKRNKIKYTKSFPSLKNASINKNIIREGFLKYKKRLKEGVCPEDAYNSLVGSLYKSGYTKNGSLKAANSVAKKM